MTRGGGDEHAGRNGRRRLAAALLTSAAITATGMVAVRTEVLAQSTAQTTYSIAAGPLGVALAAFGSQSGIQVSYDASIVDGKISPGMSGTGTREQAIARLLAGTDLLYSFPDATSVLVSTPQGESISYDGSIVLEEVNVTAWVDSAGVDGAFTEETPYYTSASIAHVSGEAIDRFRGSSPADIFRGTPGVLSGEARNGGAIDVNIRGMQGMGRVHVTVDGAENALQVYQGYQGISNRTYVDPDFIAGVDITRGADIASFGNAGSVAMRTISASDIVEDGNTFGLRIKTELGTNTSAPVPGATGGYAYPLRYSDPAVAVPSATGLDRPDMFDFTQWSGSVVGAVQLDGNEFLAGYSRRSQGNYFAGANGGEGVWAAPKNFGTLPDPLWCTIAGDPSTCTYWENFISNSGMVNYRPGEEVLNTQLDTRSLLLKGTARFGDGHTLTAGYNWFNSEAGDRFSARLSSAAVQPLQQAQTSGSNLHTGTLRYAWNPEDNELVDLRANLWATSLEQRNPPRVQTNVTLESLGLPADFRSGTDTLMFGGDVINTSRLATDFGSLKLDYGTSFRVEDTQPSEGTKAAEQWLDYRDGRREEVAAYIDAEWQALDWLTLDGGLRYAHYWNEDRNTDPNLPRPGYVYGSTRSDGGPSGSLGATIEPFEGVQVYARYGNTLRLPSLYESSSAFTFSVNPDIEPERASDWEFGTNLVAEGLLSSGDRAMVKLGYFDSTVDNYLARLATMNPEFLIEIDNIYRARFTGIELSGRYENQGFTADLAANYYTGVEFCLTEAECADASLYGDYATNQVPPKYSVSLTLAQKLVDDRLTVGGRVTHVGPRAAGHGEITGGGLQSFISMIDWKPYTEIDLFAEYKVSDHLTANFRIENLTDQFYLDPLSLVKQPAPGRSFHVGLTGHF